MRSEPLTSVVWRPLPGTSQELALDTPANVTLYTGTRGPGKTDVQLMHFRRYVGVGYGAFWRGVLFDQEYKNLDDIVTKSKRWFNKFGDGARFNNSTSSYKWTWPTGEELLFRVAKDENDYWDYHGQEFPWLGWNELTKWKNGAVFDTMLSVNRSSFTPAKDGPHLPPIPLRVFATTNPFGIGHSWVKRQFIDPAPYGSIVRKEFTIFNPRTEREEKVERTQVTLFGSWRENPYLDPVYIAALQDQKDPNRRAAWNEGRWDVTAGGALDDIWRDETHVVPDFDVPREWYVDHGLDWGSSEPLCYLVFAEANGEEVTLTDGRTFAPPAGTLFVVGEYYATEEIGTNKGLKQGAHAVAEDIKVYVESLLSIGAIPRIPAPGPADNQIRDVRDAEQETIEKKLSDRGLHFTASDKSAGSRRNGLQLLRDRLQASIDGEGPGLYVMRRCQATIATVPILPRDKVKLDDVDTSAEDHAYDTLRYRVLRGVTRMAKSVNVKMPT